MPNPTLSRLLLLGALPALAGCDGIKDALPWQQFSIGSASMEPTLKQGSYVTGESVEIADLKRGDILVVRTDDIRYVARLTGLPGDRIALVGGIVVLNGEPIEQRAVGRWKVTEPGRPHDARVMSERFPGERGTHRVLDDGPSPGDNFGDIVLPTDHYFPLGDNRDHAADSRYDDRFGIGVVKAEDILRRVAPPED